jgi:hypothetical protein
MVYTVVKQLLKQSRNQRKSQRILRKKKLRKKRIKRKKLKKFKKNLKTRSQLQV